LVNAFTINARWPARVSNALKGADATFCHLRISVGGENVTAYITEDRHQEDHIEIPSYYLAEWIAENWWPLLWEPRKNDDRQSDDPDFLSRHSILMAQHGFVLPNVSLVPTGENISIYAAGRTAKYADAQFTARAESLVDRSGVEGELRKFIEGTIANLNGVSDSPLQSAWALIKNTDKDTLDFCRLIGALGLCPYDTHPAIERALDLASSILTTKQLMDLCLTSTAENVLRSALVAGKVSKALQQASDIDLSPLTAIPAPADACTLPPYYVGYLAARKLRSGFSVADRDVNGAAAVFEKLKIDSNIRNPENLDIAESPILGTTERHDSVGKVSLIKSSKPSRRFATARAAFFFWTSGSDERRLITSAATRDQQASRAFAAELLVPQAYVREQAVGGKLKWDKVQEIAEQAIAAPEVIKLQAQNIGLQLVQ
jgi:hypothetical protein